MDGINGYPYGYGWAGLRRVFKLSGGPSGGNVVMRHVVSGEVVRV